MKNFISKLQKSDEATKKKWLIFLSIISIAIIFTLWIAYLNLIVPQVAPLEIASETERKPGFFETMKIGLKLTVLEIKNRTINAFNYFKTKIISDREIIIEKSKPNFTLEANE
jgi:hypothetical protein